MPDLTFLTVAFALAPAVLMATAALLARTPGADAPAWRSFHTLAGVALLATLAGLAALLWLGPTTGALSLVGLAQSQPGVWLAVLVQLLGTVIGAFSARYLEGERAQRRYVLALAGVLAAVHVLLLANHWLVLVAAWAVVGLALQVLLCFYADRPFALLAAHKKRIADRAADVLLLAAAAMAWSEVGSGSFSDLRIHLNAHGATLMLQASAVCLVLAVMLRTALLPVHGWLIQVMEAPTPVSALLHAGVVNLGAFVLILLAPLVEAAPLARGLLVVAGLATAALAGLVMLTRVSIKVRLAWSTVAQMGFMLMQCGLGLYTLALLHLLGHSLYKAHAFLASSSAVRDSKLQGLRGPVTVAPLSLVGAPLVAAVVVFAVHALATALAQSASPLWPWWWSALLALAWAPLLWLSVQSSGAGSAGKTAGTLTAQAGAGLGLVAGLSVLACLAHALPLGAGDASGGAEGLGLLALAGMAWLYLCLALLQWQPDTLENWRRWSYAGFYVDEFYTRVALRLAPGAWAASSLPAVPHAPDAQADAHRIAVPK
ncbi:MAG: NADH-quinone oxidoreductase subunit L [Serpentinimonas sp.]|nr:NADH-quinone oxidoreductase subunit L [Serpentinimonas sp.]